MLPYPCWPEKEGTVFNSGGMELKVNKVREPLTVPAEVLSFLK
jgi:hypothetical protein